MKVALRVFLLLLAVGMTRQTQVGAVTLSVDTILGPDHPYTNETITIVDGPAPPTRVDILEGALIGGPPSEPAVPIGLDVYGQSVVTMFGGRVKGRDQSVLLHDQSTFHMFDGRIATSPIEARDKSRVFFDGGDWSVKGYDNSVLFVNGGLQGDLNSVRTFGEAHAVVEVHGGVSMALITDETSTAIIKDGFFEHAQAIGNSEILIDGGDLLLSFSAFENGVVRLRGADVLSTEEEIRVRDNGTVHIYGTGLHFDFDEDFGNVVVGTLADGYEIRAPYLLQDNGQIILHEVPEPGTFALLALGALALLPRCLRRVGKGGSTLFGE